MNGHHLQRVRVWDLPTRVFHWLLAGCVAALVITGQIGGEWMPWHARLGYSVAALLAFRLVWGFVGGHWSRFSTFTFRPSKVIAYLRGAATASAGHSPVGSISVFLMLAVLALQVATGLFSDDTADFSGPLNRFISNATGKLFTLYHKDVGQWAVIALVIVHVGAIAFYKWRRQLSLTAPMVHGYKELAGSAPSSRDDATSRFGAALLFAAFVALVVALVNAAG